MHFAVCGKRHGYSYRRNHGKPVFEVNAPLLSRMKIIRLERLDKNAVKKILQKALTDKENGYGRQGLAMTDEALEALADFCGGDARVALNLLEQAEFMLPDGVKTIDGAVLKSVMGDAFKRYDKRATAITIRYRRL